MADSFVQVAPDSTGKEIQCYQNTVNSQTVQAQAVVLVSSSGAPIANATQRTPASSVVTSSGSVSAGAQSVQFIPSSTFTGTLLGAAWPGTTAAVGFSANGNDTLAAIAYTVSTGSLTIITIT